MIKRKLLRFICVLLVFAFTLAPFNAYALQSGFLNGLGYDFLSFLGREKPEDPHYDIIEEMSYDDDQCVEAGETSAIIYLEKSYMSLQAEQYNIVLDNWVPIQIEHNGNSVILNNLVQSAFYKIRLSYMGNKIGEYSFYTIPPRVQNFNLEIDEDKRIILNWDNPDNMLTEIFKKKEGEYLKYIGCTNEASYKDYAVKQGEKYTYKLRFVVKNSEAVSFSGFTGASTFIEEDINDVVNTKGYILIRQNDINNRNIPYPYNDNGKTIGTSGCGVCSSLMVIRNTTSQSPTLEAYTKELLDAGCRKSYGSDMLAIAAYVRNNYHMSYVTTRSVEVLERHLDKGYMATVHVGKNQMFANGGHYMTVAGYIKSDEGDRAIILDPYFSTKKYSDLRRVEAGIEYTDDYIVTAPFKTLLDDCKGEYFVLFTPEK